MRVVVLTEEQNDLLFDLLNGQNHRLRLAPGEGKLLSDIISALANASRLTDEDRLVLTGSAISALLAQPAE